MKTDVIVVGAGAAGILAGVKLSVSGIKNFVILEAAAEFGGTWRDNTYPGVACDVPSRHYCYSFDPNPNWSCRYPGGKEINSYLQRVATKYHLLDRAHFNQRVARAEWRDSFWHLETEDGTLWTAPIVVCATGVLCNPYYPEIEGIELFSGESMHSARWRNDIQLRGKRVGIIGSGTTASQIVPSIASLVESLVVFQRTPSWHFPLPNRRYSCFENWLGNRFPKLLRMQHWALGLFLEKMYGNALVGRNWIAKKFIDAYCRASLLTVRDQGLRMRLTPDYTPGCKRLVFSGKFYSAIQNESVSIETSTIKSIENTGIRTLSDQFYELDVLVFATGFRSDEYMQAIEFVGENGITLSDIWRERHASFQSVFVSHMPNLFLVVGPYSPIANLSVIQVAEWQVDCIVRGVKTILEKGVNMTVKPEVVDAYMDYIKRGSSRTVWGAGCTSWYLGKDGLPILYPYSPRRFRYALKHSPNLLDFKLTSRTQLDGMH
jgi:cation diffusion facilitator CzcD-associated flavoprotein CzcO